MINYIDEEEKELIESLNSDSWISDFNPEMKKQYEKFAKNSLNNTRQVTALISERDFNKINLKAIQEGVPSEYLIAMLIHNYNEGKIGLNL